MHTLKYNDNGDWVLNELVYGDEQLIQNLKHLFRQRVTEWLFDERQGFRHEDVWKKKIERRAFVQAIHDCAYQEPRVAEVLSVDYEYEKIKRCLKLKFKARTLTGSEIGVEFDVNTSRL
ncbi:hypothetical protein [Solibacillus sp. CAU 1738]|uniref:hypothetical protein n=1 Tax=Solibacillus sp. CAU 1738 TaxID=3140363 RepID=UPI0032606F9D